MDKVMIKMKFIIGKSILQLVFLLVLSLVFSNNTYAQSKLFYLLKLKEDDVPGFILKDEHTTLESYDLKGLTDYEPEIETLKEYASRTHYPKFIQTWDKVVKKNSKSTVVAQIVLDYNMLDTSVQALISMRSHLFKSGGVFHPLKREIGHYSVVADDNQVIFAFGKAFFSINVDGKYVKIDDPFFKEMVDKLMNRMDEHYSRINVNPAEMMRELYLLEYMNFIKDDREEADPKVKPLNILEPRLLANLKNAQNILIKDISNEEKLKLIKNPLDAFIEEVKALSKRIPKRDDAALDDYGLGENKYKELGIHIQKPVEKALITEIQSIIDRLKKED